MLQIENDVREMYPATTFGIMVMRGVTIGDPSPGFGQYKKELRADLRKTFSGKDKKEMRALPPFSHYHEYYRKFKKTYHVLHQCASIASGDKDLPNGAPLVQAMFMAEMQHQLLTAGYDCRELKPPFSVHLSDGNARFLGMGEKICTPPENDILFSAGKTVLGSILCGPDHDHRLMASTTDILFAVYGVPGISVEGIRKHLEHAAMLVRLLDPRAKAECLAVQ